MNGAAEALTGWTLAESVSRPMTEVFNILHEYTRTEAENPVQRVLREGCVVGLANHTVLISKNGSERPIEDSAAPIRSSDGRLIGVVLVFHDVSERKKSEAALRASERRFRLWTELNVIATGISDLAGHFLEANDALLQLLGYTRDELDKGQFNWRDLTPSEHLERDYKAIGEARTRGACQPYEKEYFHKNGRRVPVIIGYALFHDPDRHDRQQTHDLAICFIVDISDRKRAEEFLEQRVEERTARLKTALADLEAFSYTVSHDLRAPLRSMQTYSQFLLEDHGVSLNEEAKGYLAKIVKSGAHLDRLIQDVLTYSQISKGDVPMTPIDLERLMHDLLERYPHFSSDMARIEIASGLPRVRGNEALLTQCFSNLIGNAIKFVPVGRQPHVRIHAETRGNRVVVWVEDNGIGIAAENRERIFGIFERLHSAGTYEGTGIGLSIVRRTLDKMDGRAGVESDPGQGSRFWVELNVA
jgi:PAS domain S-box-containing protein